MMGTSQKRFELEFKEHPEYLHARISAPYIDYSMAMSYLSEVMSECANRRCKRLLLERDIPDMMPEDELFKSMDYLVSLDSGGTRIAFLNPHTSVAEALQHIVDYGAGRGGVYRYFQDFDEAEAWLLEDET